MDNLNSDSQSSQGVNFQSDDDATIVVEIQNSKANQTELMNGIDVSIQYKELSQKVHKQFQLIYIAAYSEAYRQKLQEIAHTYGCDLSFVKNSYIVYCKDDSKYQAWSICKQLINQQINKIVYSKIDEKQKRFRVYNCLQVNRIANQKGIYFCLFNNEVYIHTSSFTEKQLDEERKKLLKFCNVYAVCFCKKKNIETIDMQIVKFFKIVLKQHYSERFQKNNLVVELDRSQRSFYILGKPGATAANMMGAKGTIKSLIESLTIVAFKNTNLGPKQQAKLREYLNRISKFPIVLGKLSQTVIIVLSKDNIIRDLLKKTEKVQVKFGIKSETHVGIYIPMCNSKDDKKEQIHKICKQMGYDYWIIWGIRYFRPMIANDDGVKNPSEILELIIRIVAGFNQVKDKYEIMRKDKQPQRKLDAKQKKQLEQQSKYAYLLKNISKDYKQLMKLLRRDVTEDQVLMKQRYNVIYNVLEGKQIGPYYIDKKEYDRGVQKGQIELIEQKDLKKGEFFEVILKVSYTASQVNKIEQIQAILIEELRKLKQGAIADKIQSKSFDSSRKIAHMLKKMIIVF